MDDPVDSWFVPEPRTVWTKLKSLYQGVFPIPVAVCGFLWLLYVHVGHHPRPPVGTYVAILACLAVVVTIWPPEWKGAKVAWLMVFLALALLEIAVLFQDRAENQAQQAERLSEEKRAFGEIATNLKTSMKENQAAFDATMRHMTTLSKLSQEGMDEVTGGQSYCYLEVRGWGTSDQVVGYLLGVGNHPLSDVNVTVIDADELDKMSRNGPWTESGLEQVRHRWYFQSPTHYVGRMKTLWQNTPAPTTTKMRFNANISALNGVFTTLLLVNKVGKSWQNALEVTTSYYDKVHGLVLEKVDPDFPVNVLEADKEWNELKKLNRIKIRE